MTDDSKTQALRKKLQQIETRQRRLQKQLNELTPSDVDRRELLKAGGMGATAALLGGGAGLGAYSAATEPAQASHGSGDIGTPTDRVDTVYSHTVDSGSVSAGEVNIGEGLSDGQTEVLEKHKLSDGTIINNVLAQRTLGVGTTSTEIIDQGVPDAGSVVNATGYVWSRGASGGNEWFIDKLVMTFAGSVSVVGSETRGGPPGRTYSIGAQTLSLSLASGSHDVYCRVEGGNF